MPNGSRVNLKSQNPKPCLDRGTAGMNHRTRRGRGDEHRKKGSGRRPPRSKNKRSSSTRLSIAAPVFCVTERAEDDDDRVLVEDHHAKQDDDDRRGSRKLKTTRIERTRNGRQQVLETNAKRLATRKSSLWSTTGVGDQRERGMTSCC